MNARRVVAAVVLLAGLVMLTAGTYRRREFQRWLDEETASPDRYVDAAVNIQRVVADPKGKELVEGRPLLRTVGDVHRAGGWIDTKCSPPRVMTERHRGMLRFGEDPTDPDSYDVRTWYVSDDQWKVIHHTDLEPVGKLALGGMGAGKTTAGVVWAYLRWIESIGQRREGLITAPTQARLEVVLTEIFNKFDKAWYSYSTATGMLKMCDGSRIRGLSTYRQSASQGSRLQGFNSSWWLGDELQDQIDEFIHATARLRSGKKGRAKRLATATSKDSSDWRMLKDGMESSKLWTFTSMLGPDSPFVAAEHWQAMSRSMSLNQYKRLVLAEDLPSELAVYHGWDRKRNLVAAPQIATDVTASVVTGYASYLYRGQPFGLVVSHDPGVIYNTSIVMRLLMFGDVPTWVVVGEHQSKQTTAREHAQQLAVILRDRFYVNHPTIGGPLAMAFIDPHGKGEAQTDYQSVYMAFQKEGLDAFSPAPMAGRISRKARVEMVNRLLAGTAESHGVPRLVVARDERGMAVAPKLIEAFESLQKKAGDDNAEGTQRKDEDDKTHAPAALAYGLWPFEQEAFTAETTKTALREARRVRG